MIWHHQHDHKPNDCYFSKTDVSDHPYTTRKRMKYADVVTATKPEVLNDMVHSTTVHQLKKVQLVDHVQDDDHEADDEEYLPSVSCSRE